jgi:hypothetical protein
VLAVHSVRSRCGLVDPDLPMSVNNVVVEIHFPGETAEASSCPARIGGDRGGRGGGPQRTSGYGREPRPIDATASAHVGAVRVSTGWRGSPSPTASQRPNRRAAG